MILASIDVTKLDKARFVSGKNGAKYCDLILIETPNSDYGDFMIKQGVTKEEREARIEMPILGNGKHAGNGHKKPSPRPAPPAKQQDPDLDAPEDDIPF